MLAAGAKKAAESVGVGLVEKYSPVSTEAGQILEQVRFLEWLLELQTTAFEHFDILVMPKASAPEGADGVSRDDINLRFAQVVSKLQYLCYISFVDQYVNKFSDPESPLQPFLPVPNTVALSAGDAIGLTEKVGEKFMDDWNGRQETDSAAGDKICNEGVAPVVLVVSTTFPEDSNLEKKWTTIEETFKARTLRCGKGEGMVPYNAKVVKVEVGNDFTAITTQAAVELALAQHQGHVATVFVAVGDMIKPTILAIKERASRHTDYMVNHLGIITTEPLDENDNDVLEYTSTPKGARGSEDVSDVGSNAFSKADYFLKNCQYPSTSPFNGCPPGNLHGNSADSITVQHPPWKVSSSGETFKVTVSYWDAMTNCSGTATNMATFEYESSDTCHHVRTGYSLTADGVNTMMYNGTSCTSGGIVELYVDTKCRVPYQGLSTITFTPGVVTDTCIANGAKSNKVVCTPRPGGVLSASAAAPATPATPAPTPDAGGLSDGEIANIVVWSVAVVAGIALIRSNRRQEHENAGFTGIRMA